MSSECKHLRLVAVCSSIKASRSSTFMRGTSHACVQNESCTAAKVRPSFTQRVAVISMCDESNECT